MSNNINYFTNTASAIRASSYTVSNEYYGYTLFVNNGVPTNGTSGTLAGIANNTKGSLLVDVENGKLYQNTNTVDSPTWTDASDNKSIVNISDTYAITAFDSTVHCTSGTFTVTLLDASQFPGTTKNIKNSGLGVITVATTASQTIDGNLTVSLKQYDNLTIQSDGSNWIIL
jgi:hypothetical protein